MGTDRVDNALATLSRAMAARAAAGVRRAGSCSEASAGLGSEQECPFGLVALQRASEPVGVFWSDVGEVSALTPGVVMTP
jgi:hypothetical protein